jgi:hypothetical protein
MMQQVQRIQRSMSPDNNSDIQRIFSSLRTIEDRIGYQFQDRTLFIEAITHGSYLSVIIPMRMRWFIFFIHSFMFWL